MRNAQYASMPEAGCAHQEFFMQLKRSLLALLRPREMSDLSPQSGPKRTLDQFAVTNRDTRPNLKACLSSSLQIAHVGAARAARNFTIAIAGSPPVRCNQR